MIPVTERGERRNELCSGIVTAVVGAGGGFPIIPALVLFAPLPMEKAVGTLLIIISAKSLVGFLGDLGSGQVIDIGFIYAIAAEVLM